MKWEEEMEVEEIEGVLERIWDLHDKLSHAIHSTSRAHFLNTVKARKSHAQAQASSDEFHKKKNGDDDADDGKNSNRTGYVFVKGHGPVEEDGDDDSAVQEAKSLNGIRTALENLEDQLEFLHTVKTQQRAERDAAIAHLEQSRMVLAMRLAEHHGKKYKVIEEAQAFVGDVQDASRLISSETLYGPVLGVSSENLVSHEGKRSNVLNLLLSKFNFFKKSLKLHQMGGILGNAALVAISMLVLVHVQQASHKDNLDLFLRQDEAIFKRSLTKVSRHEGPSSAGCSTQLDVQLARG